MVCGLRFMVRGSQFVVRGSVNVKCVQCGLVSDIMEFGGGGSSCTSVSEEVGASGAEEGLFGGQRATEVSGSMEDDVCEEDVREDVQVKNASEEETHEEDESEREIVKGKSKGPGRKRS